MMVDVLELKQDFKSHLTITEVCMKHKITLGEALCLIQPKYARNQSSPNRTNEHYIQELNGRFYIRKRRRNKIRSYGGYSTLEEAIKVRDKLMNCEWDRSKLEQIKKEVLQ